MAEGCLSVDDSVLIKVGVGYWKLFLYLSVVLSFFFFFCNCFVPILNLICQTYCTQDRELLRSGNDNSKDTDYRNGNGDVEAH